MSCILNPVSGDIFYGLDSAPSCEHVVSAVIYCISKYGTTYHKRTMIWGNFPASWAPLTCNYDCEACDKAKKMDLRTAQRGDGWTVHDLHCIPSTLCASLAVACDKEIKS